MIDNSKKLERVRNRLYRHIESFEKQFAAQSPSIATIEEWQNTKIKLKSGIQEIIDTAQPPYALYKHSLPVILLATPEIVYLPKHMGSLANIITTGDGGGLADISAALVAELDRQGVNVHVTLPEYANLFRDLAKITNREYRTLRNHFEDNGRVHPIVDDIFRMAQKVYDDSSAHLDHINLRRANAFSRGVISRLLPRLNAQYKHVLVHCNDWMTGLIPPGARAQHIHSLMTFHNVFSMHQRPSGLRKHSIDIEPFWKDLIYSDLGHRPYRSFKKIVETDPYIDFMSSGLHAANFINTVSRTFLKEMVGGYFEEHEIMSERLRSVVIRRHQEGCAKGIRNAPPSNANPEKDRALAARYGLHPNPEKGILSIGEGKQQNKAVFQKEMGLPVNPGAPLFFWPSRIARPQKGFDLLLKLIPLLIETYGKEKIQLAVVANGEAKLVAEIKALAKAYPEHICYRSFSRTVSARGLAGADFVLMPSLYEPCGTPQVVGQLYGTPPIVRKTGGLADTVRHLSFNGINGSGFVFELYDADGLAFGVAEAMRFFRREDAFRYRVLERIMREAQAKFNIKDTARKYIEVYEEIFRRSGQPVKIV